MSHFFVPSSQSTFLLQFIVGIVCICITQWGKTILFSFKIRTYIMYYNIHITVETAINGQVVAFLEI